MADLFFGEGLKFVVTRNVFGLVGVSWSHLECFGLTLNPSPENGEGLKICGHPKCLRFGSGFVESPGVLLV